MSSWFEWDAEKDRINREKHGISFEEARVISSRLPTASDKRQDYGEKRFISCNPVSRSSSSWFTPAVMGEPG